LVYRVTFLMQLKDQIHKLAFLVPGIVQIWAYHCYFFKKLGVIVTHFPVLLFVLLIVLIALFLWTCFWRALAPLRIGIIRIPMERSLRLISV
jgi:hypothetical protein